MQDLALNGALASLISSPTPLDCVDSREADTAMPDAWMLRSPTPSPPRMRLYCFGYACGGASAFETWPDRLDSRIEVCRLQLPGRENRRDEPPLLRLDALYRVFERISEQNDALPFAFFGYCMGGRIALAVARHLRRQQLALPSALFIAATREPGCMWPTEPPTYEFDDAGLLRFAAPFGGIPSCVLDDPRRLRRFLALLRADIELNETIDFAPEPPFACPLTLFSGRDDEAVRPEHLTPWKDHTSGPLTLQLLAGAHMFLHKQSDAILAQINTQMAAMM
jgi:medium-chain acyl-[acyl-carrier-protein] hydrolase